MITTTQRELDALKKRNYIAEGGEADIAGYDENTVIKIFKDKNPQTGIPIDIKRKEIVVKCFITRKFPKNVVGPIDSVYVGKSFKAYTMKKLKEDDPVRQLTKRNYLKKNKISNKEALRKAIIVAKIVTELHNIGYIIGDINDQNFCIMGNDVYAVDTDSFGIKGQVHAVTYTENYTAPEAYKPKGVIELTEETDHFALAVLCFYILAQVHPFGGTYAKEPMWKFKERIANKISVLGPHNVEVRSTTPSWNWMSPQLLQKFKEIFEEGSRENILPYLEELYNNMSYCQKHKGYYYSKFGECPVCNKNAKMQSIPKKQPAANTSNIAIRIIFESDDIECILSDRVYLSKDHKIVHRKTEKRVDINGKSIIEFTRDGKYIIEIKDDVINIQDNYSQRTYKIEKMHKSNYDMVDDTLYYVDRNSRLKSIKLTKRGTFEKSEEFVYKPIFRIIDDKIRFIASFYPQRAIVVVNGAQTYEFDCRETVTEYVLKYDEYTKRWLFIYEKSDGTFRTLVFGEKDILVDNTTWKYSAMPLSGICFAGNTIYQPGNQEIIGLNITTNNTKSFPCKVVAENSYLEFIDGGFTITNTDKVYRFGN